MDYKWFYRSDENPMLLYFEGAQWTYYGDEKSDEIEGEYQFYDLKSRYEELEFNKEAIKFKLKDNNYEINFAFGVQKDGDKERFVGRFLGDVNQIKDLKNELSSNVYRWYFDSSENNTSRIWSPFRLDINDQIDREYYNFNMSKGPNIYENENFTINFTNFEINWKNENTSKKLERKNYCPKNVTRIDYFNNDINPQKQKNTISTLSDETIQNIEKDYFLTFKNIFPPISNKIILTQIIKFFCNKERKSIIIQIYSEGNKISYKNESSDDILNKLEDDSYIEICEMIKFCDTDELKITFRENIPFRIFRQILKSKWYSKYNKQNEDFWEQFDEEENDLINHHYKQKFLPHQLSKISYIYKNDLIKIDFKLNKYTSSKSEKLIKRFNPQYGFQEEISRIYIPQEFYVKEMSQIEKHNITNENVTYANKFGPKTFNELKNEITKEMKNMGESLNLSEMFNHYNDKYLCRIRPHNFIALIIKIYTEEGFVYKTLNKMLREKKYDDLLKFRYYYFSLLYSIDKYNFNENKTINRIYRGLSYKFELNDFFINKLKENEMILFNEFLSTSTDQNAALLYAKKDGFLFEIEVSDLIKISSIEQFSEFSHEKEILLVSGCILKFKGYSLNLENSPKLLKFNLIESNSMAFYYLILENKNPTINLKNVDLDYLTMEKLFKAVEENSIIEQLKLRISQSSLLEFLVNSIISLPPKIICIEVERKGEIRNKRIIKINYEKTKNLVINNFGNEDFDIFLLSILKLNIKIRYLYADKLSQISLQNIINKFQNDENLTSLELYRDSDLYLKNFYNLDKLLNSNLNLINLELNLYHPDEITYFSETLVQNDSLKKIKIVYERAEISSIKNIYVRRKNDKGLSFELIDFDNSNFQIFLKNYLKKENKIKELHLSNNYISEFLMKILTDFLKENNSLEKLILVKCSIMDELFRNISTVLKGNKTLKKLNLENNKLTNNITTIIAELENQGIYINLNYNNVDNSDLLNSINQIIPNSKLKISQKMEILKAHNGPITAVINLNDDLIASGSTDNVIKIWDVKTNCKKIKELEGHNNAISCLKFIDDNLIVSGSIDRTIKIWDMNNDYKCIDTLRNFIGEIKCIENNYEKNIIYASDDNNIKVWKKDINYNLIKTIKAHKISSILITNLLLIAGSKDTIGLWGINEDYTFILALLGHNDTINSLIMEKDNLISASDDKTIKVWDINLCTCIFTLNSHNGKIKSINIKNKILISISEEFVMKLWDCEKEFKCIKTSQLDCKNSFSIISNIKNKIIIGTKDKSIKIWDMNDKFKCINTLKENTHNSTTLIQLKDDKIVSGAVDNSIKIWDPNDNNKCIKTLIEHTDAISSLLLLKDGKIVSGSRDNTIKIWDSDDNFKCIQTLTEHTDWVSSLIQLNDDKIISGADDKTIKIWDPKDNYKCIKTLKEHSNWVRSLIQLNDGKFISGSADKTIKIWDPKDNFKCIKTLTEHTNWVKSLIQLNDGKIISGSADKTIKIWDPNDNFKCIKTIIGHTDAISSLVVLKDGKIVSGAADKTIKIWDPNDNFKCIQTLTEHTNFINILIQLNDGKIGSRSADKTIKIWDPNDIYYCIQTLKEHTYWVRSLIQLSDGKIVSGSADKTIKIWDPNDNFKCIKTLKEHTDEISTLLNLNDKIISGSADKTIKIWDPYNNFHSIQTLIEHTDTISSLVMLSGSKIISGSADKTIKIWDSNDNFKCIQTLTEHTDRVCSLIQLNDGKIVSASYDKTLKIWI